jgi:hypothetical protein
VALSAAVLTLRASLPHEDDVRALSHGDAGERYQGGCHGRHAGIDRHELEPIIPDPFTHGRRHMTGAGRSS